MSELYFIFFKYTQNEYTYINSSYHGRLHGPNESQLIQD